MLEQINYYERAKLQIGRNGTPERRSVIFSEVLESSPPEVHLHYTCRTVKDKDTLCILARLENIFTLRQHLISNRKYSCRLGNYRKQSNEGKIRMNKFHSVYTYPLEGFGNVASCRFFGCRDIPSGEGSDGMMISQITGFAPGHFQYFVTISY